MKKDFLEKWILDLIKLEYELGNIPKRATYKLKERMDNFIEVTLIWLNKENVEYKIIYSARAYGKKSIAVSCETINESLFDMESYYTLEIHKYVNNIKRSYSTRKIVDYDVMNVVGELQKLDETRGLDL
ncbi:hypothetical protein LV716_05495 [Flagellimonas sp. HMM57]|uniref:hypothetical protein n=1 Tax=unclassified Flagellimonas TaxID=2644544 RepID=UPI0013D33005|nr:MULTISPECIES: hypothetical protein [unclassified Flagellimonas]UII77226.1 hypothetical protein LV716_05495 [Flagellimonas sp. HMM57]